MFPVFQVLLFNPMMNSTSQQFLLFAQADLDLPKEFLFNSWEEVLIF